MDGGKKDNLKQFPHIYSISYLLYKSLKAVYEWDVINGKRIGEYVLKNCSYTSVGLSLDGKNIYTVGSDRKLKEISDSQV